MSGVKIFNDLAVQNLVSRIEADLKNHKTNCESNDQDQMIASADMTLDDIMLAIETFKSRYKAWEE